MLDFCATDRNSTHKLSNRHSNFLTNIPWWRFIALKFRGLLTQKVLDTLPAAEGDRKLESVMVE